MRLKLGLVALFRERLRLRLHAKIRSVEFLDGDSEDEEAISTTELRMCLLFASFLTDAGGDGDADRLNEALKRADKPGVANAVAMLNEALDAVEMAFRSQLGVVLDETEEGGSMTLAELQVFVDTTVEQCCEVLNRHMGPIKLPPKKK